MDRTRVVVPKQLKTRLSWVLGIVALGVTETVLNISSVAYFSRSDLNRCLLIGPPTLVLWIVQVAFASLGAALFVLETLNTASIFRYGGETTFVPIHVELLVTLPVKYIPTAAINFFIAKSREQYATALQQVMGTCQIAYVFTRMLWYAHIEGKKVKKNDKYKIQRVFFMFVCVLFACMMVFPITMWKDQNNVRLMEHHMKNVSVYFVSLPASMDGRLLADEHADDVLAVEGFTARRPYLVASLLAVHRAGDYGYNVTFACRQNASVFLPYECLARRSGDDAAAPSALRFKLLFNDDAPVCHLGEVVYDYAVIYGGGGGAGNQTCVPSAGDFRGGWRLSYYYTRKSKHQQVTHVDLTSPWLGSWVVPVPTYQPDMVAAC